MAARDKPPRELSVSAASLQRQAVCQARPALVHEALRLSPRREIIADAPVVGTFLGGGEVAGRELIVGPMVGDALTAIPLAGAGLVGAVAPSQIFLEMLALHGDLPPPS